MDFVFAYVGPGHYLSLSFYIKGKQVLDITSHIYLDLIILESHLFLLFPLEPLLPPLARLSILYRSDCPP